MIIDRAGFEAYAKCEACGNKQRAAFDNNPMSACDRHLYPTGWGALREIQKSGYPRSTALCPKCIARARAALEDNK